MGPHLGILCLVVLSLWSTLQVSGYYQVMDCCVRTSPVRIPARYVHRYREQHIQEGCPVRATVFVTVRGKHLCAPAHAWWVKHLKAWLDRPHRQRKLWSRF